MHFEDGAEGVSFWFLPIKAANNQFMTICNLSPRRLPIIPDQKLLTLCWRSFHHGAARVLHSVLPIKATKNFFITGYSLWEVWFPMTHDQKLLPLHWRSFSWWGREGIAICFGYKDWQRYVYDWVWPIGGVISQDTWPKIVDAPLTLIFMMVQRWYYYLFWL